MAGISEPELMAATRQQIRTAVRARTPPNSNAMLVTGLHGRGLPERILRRAEVEQTTGLPRATIYDKIAKGMFPRPIKLGERSGRLARDGNHRVAEGSRRRA